MLGTENILFVGSCWTWQAFRLFNVATMCDVRARGRDGTQRGEIILHLQAASMVIELIELCRDFLYFSSRYVIV